MWFTSIDKQLLHSGACEHRGQHGRCRHRRYCGPCGPTSGMKYRKTLPGCFEMTEKRLWVCAYNEWKKSNITYGGGDKVAAEKTPGRNVQAEYETDSHLNCEHQKKRLETSLRQQLYVVLTSISWLLLLESLFASKERQEQIQFNRCRESIMFPIQWKASASHWIVEPYRKYCMLLHFLAKR